MALTHGTEEKDDLRAEVGSLSEQADVRESGGAVVVSAWAGREWGCLTENGKRRRGKGPAGQVGGSLDDPE